MASTQQKLYISVLSSLIFMVIASPFMYRITSQLPGLGSTSMAGCPNVLGLLLHTIVFGLITFAIMFIPDKKLPKYPQ